uniref:Uncharacterized protein n=1 Tax=Aegilops tauschii TaxID=37682 RepID=M8B3X5_AEGTA
MYIDQETQMRFHVRCCPRLSTSLSCKGHGTAALSSAQSEAGEEEQQQQQDRAGTVSLFSVDAGAEDESRRLRLLRPVETAGVFDMKWSPTAPLLAQADAHGRLVLRRLEHEDGSDEGF